MTAAAVVALVLAGLWWADADGGVVPVLQGGYLLVPPIAVVVAVLSGSLRRRTALAIAALALVVGAANLASAAWPAGPRGSPGPADARRGALVVAGANLYFGKGDLTALAATVREHRVDVLVLTECPPVTALRAQGGDLGALLPHHSGDTNGEASGTLVLSRHPLRLFPDDASPPSIHQQPLVEFTVDGTVVRLLAVHTTSPTSEVGHWRDDQRALAEWRRRQPAGQSLVLVGDFNAQPAHPAFRGVSAGMIDALPAAVSGWVGTWPGQRRTPPFAQLDHVLVQGFQVQDAGVFDIPRSDHRGVWAALVRDG